jgi:hypothetical protein
VPKAVLGGTPEEAKIRELRAKGVSVDRIANMLKVPRDQVQTITDRMRKEAAALRLDAPPKVKDGATPRERAEVHTKWLKEQVDKAVKDGAPAKEIAALSNQYVSAMRLEALLTGALEVTAAQVIRSSDFQRALAALRRACGDDLRVWEAFAAELRVLTGEG